MPVPINKYNQLISYLNKIKDQIDVPVIKLQAMRDFAEEARTDENIIQIPLVDSITITCYYILEIVQMEDNFIGKRKIEYLSEVINDVIEVLKTQTPDSHERLRNIWRKAKQDNPRPQYENLIYITRTLTQNVIKLMHEIQPQHNEEGQPGEQENNLYLPDWIQVHLNLSKTQENPLTFGQGQKAHPKITTWTRSEKYDAGFSCKMMNKHKWDQNKITLWKYFYVQQEEGKRDKNPTPFFPKILIKYNTKQQIKQIQTKNNMTKKHGKKEKDGHQQWPDYDVQHNL